MPDFTPINQKKIRVQRLTDTKAAVDVIGYNGLENDEAIKEPLGYAKAALNCPKPLMRSNNCGEQGSANDSEKAERESEEADRVDSMDDGESENKKPAAGCQEYEREDAEDEREDEDVEMADAMGDRFQCKWKDCTQVKNAADELLAHLTEDHIGRVKNGTVQLTCAWGSCISRHKRRAHMVAHVEIHIPTREECKICGQVFQHPRSKRKHDLVGHTSFITKTRRLKAKLTANNEAKTQLSRVQVSRVQKTKTVGRGRAAGQCRC